MTDNKASTRDDASTQPAEEYVTKEGDTLAMVAQMYYGDGSQENSLPIYEANREVIGDNPNLLRPGLTLKIPPEDQKWPVGVNRD